MLLWQVIAVQAVTFGLLIFFLWQLFYRQANLTRERLEHLHQDNLKREQELARLRTETEQELSAKTQQVEDDLRRLRAETDHELQLMRQEARAAATAEAERIVTESRLTGEHLQARLAAEADQKAVALAAEILRHLFASRVVEAVHHHLMAGQIEELGRLDTQRLSLDGEVVEIKASLPLTLVQREALAAILSSKAGRPVTLSETTDPTLIAGIVLTMGTFVLDGSLKTKLEAALSHVREAVAR